ncbi:MAG: hypothetical protein JW928_01940 [Candidatus Aureabacteria bacterium]|nr:hypothetical protein [Candidatus Auribacterota bacterium]
MKIKFIFIFVLISVFLAGCVTTGTKDLPESETTQAFIGPPDVFQDKSVGVYIIYQHAKIEGGHHEGLMQVKQPWIFGMSKEQKDFLYGQAGEFASHAFTNELGRQGINVTPLKEWSEKLFKKHDYLVTARIEKIILNTFGRGTVEGFGSAGDYWEARIFFSDITVKETHAEKILFHGNTETYAKLKPCPVKLDWTFLSLVNRSLNSSLQMQEMQEAKTALQALSKGKAYLKNWEASYSIEGYQMTPMEVAARKAACELIGKLR